MERAFELDAFGLLWYREIVIVVPRQSGKTTLIVPWGVHRATRWIERQVILYTAQTRNKAREKFIDDQIYTLRRSPFVRTWKREPSLAHGEEHMLFGNDSKWSIEAPTETAGHGSTLDLGVIDEAFAQVDGRVEQAMSPAMITREDSQKLIISTAGKSKLTSPFLWGKVEAGRNRVNAGLDSRTLYIEFSAPDDADWLDPLTWWSTMPALGFTVTEEKVAAEAESLGETEFRRAYLNQWRDMMHSEWKIPEPKWTLCMDKDAGITDKIVWAIDVSPDRARISISVASLLPEGPVFIEAIETFASTTDAIEALAQLVADHGGLVFYDHVTTGSLAPDMDEAGIVAFPITARDVIQAAAALYDAVVNHRVRHTGDYVLTEALSGAATRKVGEGWTWARGPSMSDISSLVAATIAHWMLLKTRGDLNYDPLAVMREGVNDADATQRHEL